MMSDEKGIHSAMPLSPTKFDHDRAARELIEDHAIPEVRIKALQARIAQLEREITEARRYLLDNVFLPNHPTGKGLDDLMGVCTQIDNLVMSLHVGLAARAASNEEICQTLGKALGYPWLKDDPKNFPEADESHGVCVGDHVAETLALEAARALAARDRGVRGGATEGGGDD